MTPMKQIDTRRRHVVSYENMSETVAAAFNAKYPKGFNDYLQDLTRYTKPDGTPGRSVPGRLSYWPQPAARRRVKTLSGSAVTCL